MAGWKAHFHASRLPEPDGVLRVRHAVHQYDCDRETRDQQLALAALSTRLHDCDCLHHESVGVPNRQRPRLLIQASKRDLFEGDPAVFTKRRNAVNGQHNLLTWKIVIGAHFELSLDVKTTNC